VGSITVGQSAEDARRALMARAENPIAAPAATSGLLLGVSPQACAESPASATPVAVYKVTLDPAGTGNVGAPECWQLPSFDDEIAQRAVAVCVPAGTALAVDAVRSAVGSMYEPIVEALWHEMEAGSVRGETLAVLLSAARPNTAPKRP
jgi:hypothetical protein